MTDKELIKALGGGVGVVQALSLLPLKRMGVTPPKPHDINRWASRGIPVRRKNLMFILAQRAGLPWRPAWIKGGGDD